jgi:hypothetical protein
MLARFGSRCAITGPQPLAVLDAAHLYRYCDLKRHHLDGGLLLRRDLHSLLDRGHLAIEPGSLVVRVSPEAGEYDDYGALSGRRLEIPAELAPADRFLEAHLRWATHQW